MELEKLAVSPRLSYEQQHVFLIDEALPHDFSSLYHSTRNIHNKFIQSRKSEYAIELIIQSFLISLLLFHIWINLNNKNTDNPVAVNFISVQRDYETLYSHSHYKWIFVPFRNRDIAIISYLFVDILRFYIRRKTSMKLSSPGSPKWQTLHTWMRFSKIYAFRGLLAVLDMRKLKK